MAIPSAKIQRADRESSPWKPAPPETFVADGVLQTAYESRAATGIAASSYSGFACALLSGGNGLIRVAEKNGIAIAAIFNPSRAKTEDGLQVRLFDAHSHNLGGNAIPVLHLIRDAQRKRGFRGAGFWPARNATTPDWLTFKDRWGTNASRFAYFTLSSPHQRFRRGFRPRFTKFGKRSLPVCPQSILRVAEIFCTQAAPDAPRRRLPMLRKFGCVQLLSDVRVQKISRHAQDTLRAPGKDLLANLVNLDEPSPETLVRGG